MLSLLPPPFFHATQPLHWHGMCRIRRLNAKASNPNPTDPQSKRNSRASDPRHVMHARALLCPILGLGKMHQARQHGQRCDGSTSRLNLFIKDYIFAQQGWPLRPFWDYPDPVPVIPVLWIELRKNLLQSRIFANDFTEVSCKLVIRIPSPITDNTKWMKSQFFEDSSRSSLLDNSFSRVLLFLPYGSVIPWRKEWKSVVGVPSHVCWRFYFWQ